MSAADTGTTPAAYGIDFIDKDDARRIFLGLIKKVTYTGRTDTNVQFYEIGAGYGEERHTGFPCNRFGQKGFTGSGRPHQQHSLGNTCSHFSIFIRLL